MPPERARPGHGDEPSPPDLREKVLTRQVLGQRHRVHVTAGLLPGRRGNRHAKGEESGHREAADQAT